MSAEGLVVINPKDNNVNFEITFVGRDGAVKKVKTLRPGQGCKVDRKVITVTEVRRPPRLLYTDGGCVPDTGRR